MRIGRVLETHFEQPQKSVHVGLIVVTQALFFLDGFALIVEVLLRHVQRAHAIAFQPKRQWQFTRRQSLEIIRALARGRAVHRAAGVRDELKVRGFRNVLGALKHHVLEQMRESGAAFGFVARTDVIVNADGNDRHGLILIEDDPQSVIESELFDRGVWNWKSLLHLKAARNKKFE